MIVWEVNVIEIYADIKFDITQISAAEHVASNWFLIKLHHQLIHYDQL